MNTANKITLSRIFLFRRENGKSKKKKGTQFCRGGASTRPLERSIFGSARRNNKFSPYGDGFCLGKIRGRVSAPPLPFFGTDWDCCSLRFDISP